MRGRGVSIGAVRAPVRRNDTKRTEIDQSARKFPRRSLHDRDRWQVSTTSALWWAGWSGGRRKANHNTETASVRDIHWKGRHAKHHDAATDVDCVDDHAAKNLPRFKGACKSRY